MKYEKIKAQEIAACATATEKEVMNNKWMHDADRESLIAEIYKGLSENEKVGTIMRCGQKHTDAGWVIDKDSEDGNKILVETEDGFSYTICICDDAE